ncbi:MAG TPA: DinB family protein [Acidimicrobiales bacterium]|nr:DinB family protein [Acidimicrobiales bacterium]
MPDRKPPRLASAELPTLHALWQYQRESLVRKVTDVGEAAARRSPVASGTSLLWLVKHMARAEILWVLVRFAGEDLELPGDTVTEDDTLDGAIAAYRATWARVDAVALGRDLGELCHEPDVEPVPNLRWVVMHLLEETARHAGHADIIRELIDGQAGR